MTHAVNHFGRQQAALQMGWYWLVVEAFMYVTGAVIYAVSRSQNDIQFPSFANKVCYRRDSLSA